jgi:hypothetical protein
VISLAWIPFFDPLNVIFDWWPLLALPVALFIAMTYKAIRVTVYPHYWRQVSIMTIQIVLGMATLQLILFALIEWAIPLL